MAYTFDCYDCKMGNMDHPYRQNGMFSEELLISGWLASHVNEYLEEETSADDDLHWSFFCMDGLKESNPEYAFDVVKKMIAQMTTHWQAGMIAAGPLEDLIAYSPDTILPLVESQARISHRFRWVLTGVWPLGNRDTRNGIGFSQHGRDHQRSTILMKFRNSDRNQRGII